MKRLLAILLASGLASASVSCSNLTSGNGNGNGESTASVTPSANALVLIPLSVYYSGGDPGTITISGGGMTWVQVMKQAIGGGTTKYIYLFRAQGANPTAGALSFTASNNASNMSWSVDQCTGTAIDTANNGAGAIAQSATNGSSSGTAASVSLSTLQSSSSVVYAMATAGASALTFSGSSGTVLGTTQSANAVSTLPAEWQTNNATASTTLSAAHSWQMIAVEVVPPQVGSAGNRMLSY